LNQTIGSLSSSSSSTDSTATSPEALLSNFTNALQTYEASPSDSTLASAAVNAAAALAQGLNSATATVNQVREQADAGIATSVQSINSLLTQFQADAQDSRDNILTQLSQQIGITTTASPNGGMSIYTDGSVTLFQGGAARTVTFSPKTAYTPTTAGNGDMSMACRLQAARRQCPLHPAISLGLRHCVTM
jgi:flagellar hook-associated protein 1 FlgK